MLSNRPRLMAPFYNGYIYIWFYLILQTVNQPT